ncbi:type II CAAX prenyl endopeptidase Rce1 family protein, partial [Chloroflexota bacterium]
TILHYAGGVMPTVTTLIFLYFFSDEIVRRDYWRRLIDLKRISKGWYAVILLTVPALMLTGVLIDLLLGGSGAEAGTAAEIFRSPLTLIPFVIFIFLFGPLPEEMAWRGIALDGLQRVRNAFSASVFLGVMWTLWHLPLFFIEGTYQYGLGVGTDGFWLYMLDKVPVSIVMTWIFNNNRRSTAAAVLLHFMINFVGELFDLSLRAEQIAVAGWWLLAVLIVIIWKPHRFVRPGHPRNQPDHN